VELATPTLEKRVNPRRILVLQTAFLGDVLLTMPLLATLRSAFPSTSVELITTPTGSAALEGLPCVDAIHVLDKRGHHRSLSSLRQFASKIREGGIDLLLVPHRSARSALLAYALRARASATWSSAVARFATTHVLPYPWAMHEADRNLHLLQPWLSNIPPKESLRITLAAPKAQEGAAALLADVRRPFIVLATESAWATKELPEQQASQVVAQIERHGVPVVRLGSTSRSPLNSTSASIDLRGRTTIQEAAAVVARAACVISVDSASLHMASLQAVPVIGIFGPTTPEFGFGPWGTSSSIVQHSQLQCRPCSAHGQPRCPLRHHHCMTNIHTSAIAERALSFVNTQLP